MTLPQHLDGALRAACFHFAGMAPAPEDAGGIAGEVGTAGAAAPEAGAVGGGTAAAGALADDGI